LDFFKRLYDKIILGVLLLFLIVVMAIQSFSLKDTRQQVEEAHKKMRQRLSNVKIKPLGEETFIVKIETDALRLWQHEFGEGTLFDPAKFVYSRDHDPYILHYTTRYGFNDAINIEGGRLVVPEQEDDDDDDDDGQDDDKDGMSNGYEERNDLDPADPGDRHLDQDEDNFPNIEEFQAKTRANDERKHPPLITRMRLLKMESPRLRFILKNVVAQPPENRRRWEIQIKVIKSGHRSTTEFKKLGEELPDDYRIIDVAIKKIKDRRAGIMVDAPEITVQKGDDEPIVLRKNRPAYEDNPKFTFAFFYGDKPKKLAAIGIGDEFELTDTVGQVYGYKVIDGNSGSVSVEPVSGGQDIEIKKMTAEDRERFLPKKKQRILPRGGQFPGPGGMLPGMDPGRLRPGTIPPRLDRPQRGPMR